MCLRERERENNRKVEKEFQRRGSESVKLTKWNSKIENRTRVGGRTKFCHITANSHVLNWLNKFIFSR